MISKKTIGSVLVSLLLLISTGVGGSTDPGFQRLLDSARAGDPDARIFLGQLYEDGRVVRRDIVEACVWYCLASTTHRKAKEHCIRIRSQLTPEQFEYARQRWAELRRSPRSPQRGPIVVTPEIQKPVLEHKVVPEYPTSALQARMQGNVIAQLVIEANGSVSDVTVLRASNPVFVENAIAAMKQWKYQPAMQDGRPVAVYFTVVVDFLLPETQRPPTPSP